MPALRTDSVHQGPCLRLCISNKLPVTSMGLGLGTYAENHFLHPWPTKVEATAETTWCISHGKDELSSFLLFYPPHFATTSLSFPRLWPISISVTYKLWGRKLVAALLSQSYIPIFTHMPHQNFYLSFRFVSEMMKLKAEHFTTPCSRCLPERRFKFYRDWGGGTEQ